MQITLDLPDNLALTESDLRREVAIAPRHCQSDRDHAVRQNRCSVLSAISPTPPNLL